MNRPRHFNLLARVLHWSMALAILAMLFVGAGMVVTLRYREQLLDLHRPLGIASIKPYNSQCDACAANFWMAGRSAGSAGVGRVRRCLLYTSPSPRDRQKSRMPSSA